MPLCKELLLSICFFSLAICTSAFADEVSLSPQQLIAFQGKAFSLHISSSIEVSSAAASFLDKAVPYYPQGLQFRAVLGIPAETKPGIYPLIVKVESPLGTRLIKQSLTIKKTYFPAEYGRIGNATFSLLKWVAEDQAKLTNILTREAGAQYWSGKFNVPTLGKYTSPFGAHRVFNGAMIGFHRGQDIAGPVGSQIRAANAGVVAMAEKLKVHGNTIVLDHGQGIYTLYNHLSKMVVKAGDRVWKGEIIGRMGSTGFSTGSHLHWGVSIHDERVDPISFSKLDIN